VRGQEAALGWSVQGLEAGPRLEDGASPMQLRTRACNGLDSSCALCPKKSVIEWKACELMLGVKGVHACCRACRTAWLKLEALLGRKQPMTFPTAN